MNRKERPPPGISETGAGKPVSGSSSDLTVDQLLASADQHAAAGELAEAESHYRQALGLDPRHITSLFGLARIARHAGRNDVTLDLLRRAIAVNDCIPELHMRIAEVYHAVGRLPEAAAHCATAIRLRPDFAEAHFEHGNVLLDQGEVAEAASCYRSAIAARPNYFAALIDLGNTLHKLGQTDEAINAWQRAQMANPRHPTSYMNIGIALIQQGKCEEAIALFRHALELDPDYVDALCNLAKAYIASGDIPQALQSVLQALARRETPDAKATFIDCLRRLRFTTDTPHLRSIVARAVSEAWSRLDAFSAAATDLAKRSPFIADCIDRTAQAWPTRLAGDDLWPASQRTAICTDPLLRALMESTPVADLELEHFLTNTRFALLQDASASATSTAIEPYLIEFYCALARQCFINEYVYSATEDELSQARWLQQSLLAALNSQTNIPVLWPVAVAAYFPLHSLPGARPLLERHWPPAVTDLLIQQIREPLEEALLRTTIPALTPIDNAVSLAVKEQYEQNPYPRWVKTPVRLMAQTVDGALRNLFPSIAAQPVAGAKGCDILVAGCGTGQHAIDVAQRFHGARVLAVDLSLTSLSYAKRKTREMDLRNVEYAQADILKLGSIGRDFDVIEAVGVLHHLEDPFAGWRALVARLRPGGIMYVALYSAIGRQRLAAARAFIADRGYRRTAEDIRRFRQDLVASDLNLQLGIFLRSMDFFNMSGCRDLFFHAQEHRLDLTQIKTFLDDNHLRFLGFVFETEELRQFHARFPGDKAPTNLDLWQILETEHPNVFASMYQFFVQKGA
jgi:tetratricopeptide (TPR) repeat protein/2-polyprenyl-3-methyl-5-hydroxy-6-metoxy-1,4-benzoquinol methylase